MVDARRGAAQCVAAVHVGVASFTTYCSSTIGWDRRLGSNASAGVPVGKIARLQPLELFIYTFNFAAL